MPDQESRIKRLREMIRKNEEHLAETRKFLKELEKGEPARKKQTDRPKKSC